MTRVPTAQPPREERILPALRVRLVTEPGAFLLTEVAILQALRLEVFPESLECLKPLSVSEAQPKGPRYRRPIQGPTAWFPRGPTPTILLVCPSGVSRYWRCRQKTYLLNISRER